MLDAGGEYAWRVRGEEHAWTPDAIAKLQQLARELVPTYKEYAQIHQRAGDAPHDLPRLFELRFGERTPVPIEEVEPRPRS
jgi:glutamate synthase domain-containing protein 2